jgi:glutamate-1-semialdehyde 2,1-aminomutase
MADALAHDPEAADLSAAPAADGSAPRSAAAFATARSALAAGVSGSARINPALDRPLMVARGDGPRLYDLDDRTFLDFHMGFGSTLLGHANPGVARAIQQALDLGGIAGSETIYQTRLAQRLIDLVPCAERVRFANSGSEATQAAIRLARAHTGRWKILKFAGHFHGLHEHILYSAHPPRHPPETGALYPPIPESAGMPPALADLVVVAQWNDEPSVERAFREHGADLAAVICEPINYNSGCIPPRPGFLAFLRQIARGHGTLLIFDEVLSGFRTGTSCAQGYYGVTPDLCTLAKAVANGVPLAVLAGSREVMMTLSPEGPAAHSGTYSGHLFGVMAALATLDQLCRPGLYDGPRGLFAVSDRLLDGLRQIFERHGVPCRVQGIGPRFGLYFGADPDVEIWNYNQAADHDGAQLRRFARLCFDRGLYFHTYDVALGHHGFSAAQTTADVDQALDRIDDACRAGL